MTAQMKAADTNNVPKRIALYVIYDPDGILDNYRKYYLQELRKVTDHIVGVVCGTLTPESRDELTQYADDFFVRANEGHITGAWIDGIKHIGWDKLYEYDEFLMLNDSFFGPFYPLEDMFKAMEESDADFYGAFKNYPDKSMKTFGKKPLKHGYYRGAVTYFYVIKSRLLHSHEFREFWSREVNIANPYDSLYFEEVGFYDYVIDTGFRVDTYQSDHLQGFSPAPLNMNNLELIRDEKVPFMRTRPFYDTEKKDRAMEACYGKDTRRALDYIENNTDYDTNLIWDYLLRTKNSRDIWDNLQLEYVVSSKCVEEPYSYSKKCAVILHIYYEDLVELMAQYCESFPSDTDFYITTTEKSVKGKIDQAFGARNLNAKCIVRPNIGADAPTLWVTYADVVTSGKYEYICYFHDQKSLHSRYQIPGQQYAERCYENLFGNKSIVKNIINLFESNPKLGMIGPPEPYHSYYFSVVQRTWAVNRANTIQLAETMGLHVDIKQNEPPVSAYGTKFWFRSAALKKAIGHGYTYDDFRNSAYAADATLAHAMERIYGLAVQDSGYYYANVINTDEARSDLVNYQHMLNQLCAILQNKGHTLFTFEQTKNIIKQQLPQAGAPAPKPAAPAPASVPTTPPLLPEGPQKGLKAKLKKITPAPIWNFLKKIYHKIID